MTFAPPRILAVRALLLQHLPGLTPLSLGIVGSAGHNAAGTSYHLGRNQLRPGAYSVDESPRDRRGLTEAAAALDIGQFRIRTATGNHSLRTFSVWLAGQCEAGARDTADIREVIYSPDGLRVRRFDREGIRTSGDNSHLTHTHVSWYRDSEGRDKTAVFRRYLTQIGVLEDDMPSIDEIRSVVRDEVAKALKSWTEVNPDGDPAAEAVTPTFRVGGGLRMSEVRARNRTAQVLDAIDSLRADLAAAKAPAKKP